MKKAFVLLLAVFLLPFLALSQNTIKSPNARLQSTLEPTWVQKDNRVSPPSYDRFSMAYDIIRSQIVLFGGYENHCPLGAMAAVPD